jgi:integrase
MNPYPTASYANGRPYTPLRARLASSDFGLQSSAYLPESSVALTASLDWAAFWQHISSELLARHYAEGTRAQYRTILRNFYRHARGLPAATNEALIHGYLVKLTEAHYSWNWVGMNISVLRTVFDKLAGRDLTRHLTTPKRNFPLPEVLSQEAVRDLLAAATSTRDQLILGLLYGCGLKVGELRTLTWADIDAAVTTLRVRYGRNRQRNLEIPPDLQPAGGESGARHHTGRPAPTREAESASFYRTAKRGSHRTPLPRRDHQLLLPLPEL